MNVFTMVAKDYIKTNIQQACGNNHYAFKNIKNVRINAEIQIFTLHLLP